MSFVHLSVRAACAVLLVAMMTPARGSSAREARDLIHKIPPMSSARVRELIVQIPPLRPVAAPAAPAERARKAWSAPTLDEAPAQFLSPRDEVAKIHDPLPEAALRLSATGEATPAGLTLEAETAHPAAAALPLVKIRVREAMTPTFVGARAGPKDLADVLWPLAPEAELLKATRAQPSAEARGAPAGAAPVEAAPDYSLYLAAVGVLVGIVALTGWVLRKRMRRRSNARLAAMRDDPSTAAYRAVAQATAGDGPLERARDFVGRISGPGRVLPLGKTARAPDFSASPAESASMLAKVATLMRGGDPEPPPPPVNLTRIARQPRTATATALAEPLFEARAEIVEQLPATMQADEPVVARAEPQTPMVAPGSGEDAAAGMIDDLVLVEPGDAVAASAAINAARTRLEGRR
jgi:hypothetical protein